MDNEADDLNNENLDELDNQNQDDVELDEDGNPKPKAKADEEEEELDEDGNPKPKAKEEGEDDGVVVTIEGESPTPEDEEAAKAPKWVKDLRKSHRDLQKKLRERDEELNRLKNSNTEVKPVELGQKPTLESCEYDDTKFEKELEAWHERKRQVDEQKRKQEDDLRKQQEVWQGRLSAYGEQKTKLKVQDFDDAEAVAQEKLSVTQQGIIVHGSDNSALVMYALGKNPKKLEELSKITDPVKFAFAAAKLEGQLKVSNRKPAPKPEGGEVRGNRSTTTAVDSQLERLREEAAKTGDFSKVVSYKQQLKNKGKK